MDLASASACFRARVAIPPSTLGASAFAQGPLANGLAAVSDDEHDGCEALPPRAQSPRCLVREEDRRADLLRDGEAAPHRVARLSTFRRVDTTCPFTVARLADGLGLARRPDPPAAARRHDVVDLGDVALVVRVELERKSVVECRGTAGTFCAGLVTRNVVVPPPIAAVPPSLEPETSSSAVEAGEQQQDEGLHRRMMLSSQPWGQPHE